MQAQPVYDACRSVLDRLKDGKKRVVYVTPQGRPFTQKMARKLAENDDLLILCGHYEGIDERVLEEVVTDYVSIGDFVLTGGELAAMVIVDAVSRLVPGVLGNGQSALMESFHGNLLEYPQYSRPEIWHGKEVPAVLLSGNPKEIEKWQKEASLKRTRERRPDLYRHYCALTDCKSLLMGRKLNHIDMIELVNRGKAVLVWRKENEILLKEPESGIFYHTDLSSHETDPVFDFEALFKHNPGMLLCVHQQSAADFLEKKYGAELYMRCIQFAYTRKEKLPQKTYRGFQIRRLGMEYSGVVTAVYHTVEEPFYISDRIKKGALFGCFLEEKLAGFIGIHKEGSMGMLHVFEDYRRRGVGTALEAYLVNHMLEQGMTPYGQAAEDNNVSLMMQEKMGLCTAKNPVFWMRIKV